MVLVYGYAILSTSVGQNPKNSNSFIFEEWNNFIIKHIGSYESILAIIQLGKRNSRISINHSLLIDAPDPFDRANIECVLCDQVAWMFCFYLAVGFFLKLGLSNAIKNQPI